MKVQKHEINHSVYKTYKISNESLIISSGVSLVPLRKKDEIGYIHELIKIVDRIIYTDGTMCVSEDVYHGSDILGHKLRKSYYGICN